jgi:dTMP kinase
LESEGYATSATGLKRGKLAGKSIQMAMEGHTLGDATMNLSYATDFADRLERDILPALRAGFVVLLDRYIYSIIARAQVRGAEPAWIRNLLGFAIVPDVVFYLEADLKHLVPRVLKGRGFSYWESGKDFLKGRDYYDSYVEYQTQLIAQFEAMVDEFGFERINANESILTVFKVLQARIQENIKGMKPSKKLAKKMEADKKSTKPKSKKKKAEESAPKKKKERKKDNSKQAPETLSKEQSPSK